MTLGSRPHVGELDIRPIKEMRGRWNDEGMGQVINFPGKSATKSHLLSDERRHALITGLSALTFLLGFFIVGPSLALFAFGYVTTAHIGSALSCVVGLLITWAVTRVAYKHL
jgi:hypothetical protein